MTEVINSSSFPNAWGKIVQNVMNHGHDRPADDERSVIIRHAEVVVDLDHSAISDIYKHRLHPLYPQHEGLDEYIAQFNPAAPEAFRSFIDQPYTYMGRTIKQVQYLKDNHALKREFNKRNQFITWVPFEDLHSKSPPCFQNCNLVNIGDDHVHMYTHWRSHDTFAWQWNLIGLVEYVTRELLEPEGLTLVKYTEFNNSLHVYDYNWDAARKVLPLPEVALRHVLANTV